VLTALIAAAIGIAVFGASMWVIRMLATPPPPEPDPDDVVDIAVGYRCTVCGMTLTVTRAQGGSHEAPRHCREEMVETDP
jgi:hypothetical protein